MLKKYRKYLVLALLVICSVLLRIHNISMPIGNDAYAFRQTETAIVVQNYFNEGWSLFHYQMPVLGQPWTILFEFPIYQTIVYGVMKILHQTNVDLWCRIISLFTFYLSVLMLGKVVKLFLDKKAVLYVCAVYLFSPFTIMWSRAALIDFMSVLFALIYVWSLYEWILYKKKTKFVIAIISGSIAYLQKATTMFPYVFLLAFLILNYLYKEMKGNEKRITFSQIKQFVSSNLKVLILLFILCVIPGFLWTRYADSVKAQSVYTQFLTSDALKAWNYGTWEQKLDLDNWKIIFERITNFMGGVFICLFLISSYILLQCKKHTFLFLSSMISSLLSIAVLFNLYYVHDYYMIAVVPLLSICLGIILCTIISSLIKKGNTEKIIISIICVMILFSYLYSNKWYINYIVNGQMENNNVGIYINKITDANERIVIEGEDWSPITLYYANRKGFMLRSHSDATEEFYNSFLKEEKYTTLVAHSIDFIDEFSLQQNILLQYPKQGNAYVYKFYSNEDFSGRNFLIEKVYISPENQNEYWLQFSNLNILEIEYDETLAGKEIEVTIIDKDGNEYLGTVYLGKNQNIVYYKIDELSGNIMSIRFKTNF